MSAIAVISIEGVLGKRGEQLPVAEPDMVGMRFVRALQREYSTIGYLTQCNPILAADWLATYEMPSAVWVHQCTPATKVDDLAKLLGRSGDRCVLFVDSTTESFEQLSAIKVPLVLYHSELWTLGNWRPTSSWSEPPLEDGPELAPDGDQWAEDTFEPIDTKGYSR